MKHLQLFFILLLLLNYAHAEGGSRTEDLGAVQNTLNNSADRYKAIGNEKWESARKADKEMQKAEAAGDKEKAKKLKDERDKLIAEAKQAYGQANNDMANSAFNQFNERMLRENSSPEIAGLRANASADQLRSFGGQMPRGGDPIGPPSHNVTTGGLQAIDPFTSNGKLPSVDLFLPSPNPTKPTGWPNFLD